MTLVPMILALLLLLLLLLPLLLEVIIPATSANGSIQVISSRKSMTMHIGPAVKCVGPGKRDVNHLRYRRDCSLDCVGDLTCIGFNVKNSPVITTGIRTRTHISVIT